MYPYCQSNHIFYIHTFCLTIDGIHSPTPLGAGIHCAPLARAQSCAKVSRTKLFFHGNILNEVELSDIILNIVELTGQFPWNYVEKH